MNTYWERDAACRGMDTDVFFPDTEQPWNFRKARAICATCTVRIQCLEWGVQTNSRYGMFGGYTVVERDRIIAGLDPLEPPAEAHGDMAGTVTGYYRERRAQAPHCDPCRLAYNKQGRERATTYRQRRHNANP